jgi:hypothetical protein
VSLRPTQGIMRKLSCTWTLSSDRVDLLNIPPDQRDLGGICGSNLHAKGPASAESCLQQRSDRSSITRRRITAYACPLLCPISPLS